MAPNFRIEMRRNSDNLHLKLEGDFDGISAWELLNALKRDCNGVCKVFIHTNAIKNILPFGRSTFHRNLGELNGLSSQLLFTGVNAGKIAPEKSLCI